MRAWGLRPQRGPGAALLVLYPILLQRNRPGVADDVQTAGEAVIRIDQPVLIDIDIVDLDAVRGIALRWRVDDEPDLLRIMRIGDRIGPHAAVEEAANNGFRQLARRRVRPGLGEVMRTETTALLAQRSKIRRRRQHRQGDRRALVGDVPDPVALRPVL